MHFDGEIVDIRMRRSDGGGGLAHAEPDLEYLRRRAAEGAVEINGVERVRNAIDGRKIAWARACAAVVRPCRRT